MINVSNMGGSVVNEELVVVKVDWVVDPLLSKIMLIRVVDVKGTGVVDSGLPVYPNGVV